MPVVILKVRKGWTTEQKRKIVKEFTNTLVSTLTIDPDLVTIMIDEHSLEDIGHGGVLRCDEHYPPCFSLKKYPGSAPGSGKRDPVYYCVLFPVLRSS